MAGHIPRGFTCPGLQTVTHPSSNQAQCQLTTMNKGNVLTKKSYVNLYSGVSDRSHFKAAVQRQPQVRTMLEWCQLAANHKVRRMAASIPNTAPVVHFTPSRSLYQFILLGEQRHTCVSNLPRVAPSGGTARNRTRNLSITNQTPYRYTGGRHYSDRLFRQMLFRQSAVRMTQYIFSTLGICRNSRNWEQTGIGRGVGCIESTALIEALR